MFGMYRVVIFVQPHSSLSRYHIRTMPDRFVPAHAFRSDWVDPYHPDTYRCQGYDIKEYEWFTGSSKNQDQRFLIDLKDGTMDW